MIDCARYIEELYEQHEVDVDALTNAEEELNRRERGIQGTQQQHATKVARVKRENQEMQRYVAEVVQAGTVYYQGYYQLREES